MGARITTPKEIADLFGLSADTSQSINKPRYNVASTLGGG